MSSSRTSTSITSDGQPAAATSCSRRKLRLVTPQLELFDTDHTIAPGIDVRHAPGHTPGSIIIVVVSDQNDRAMLIGDIAHCPAELTEDEWEAVFDVDKDLARRTREALAAELEGSNGRHWCRALFRPSLRTPPRRAGRAILGDELTWAYGSNSFTPVTRRAQHR